MTLKNLKASLRQHSGYKVSLLLPDGEPIPAEFHVTEAGHVAKNFIDCGGTTRLLETCLLQAWVADDDKAHRLTAGKLAKILELSARVVPSDDLQVEVEYKSSAVSQYTIETSATRHDTLVFQLGHKHTDCLARESCGIEPAGAGCGCAPAHPAGKCC